MEGGQEPDRHDRDQEAAPQGSVAERWRWLRQDEWSEALSRGRVQGAYGACRPGLLGTKKTRVVKREVPKDSFFRFFDPPKMPQRHEHAEGEEHDHDEEDDEVRDGNRRPW